MTVSLTTLAEADARRCGSALVEAATTSRSMEDAAQRVCRRLYEDLRAPDGARAPVMARCYITHPFGALPPDLQRFARRAFGSVAFTPPEPAMKCLVLLATVGDEPAWNDRRSSQGHQAIPLPSPHIVERAPMIAQLIRELGLDIASVLRPRGPGERHASRGGEGVFHVERAAGSPFIPAQDFVARHAIESVVGFGGLLPSAELYSVILFSRVHVDPGVADLFRSVADDVRRALSSTERPVFEADEGSAAH